MFDGQSFVYGLLPDLSDFLFSLFFSELLHSPFLSCLFSFTLTHLKRTNSNLNKVKWTSKLSFPWLWSGKKIVGNGFLGKNHTVERPIMFHLFIKEYPFCCPPVWVELKLFVQCCWKFLWGLGAEGFTLKNRCWFSPEICRLPLLLQVLKETQKG